MTHRNETHKHLTGNRATMALKTMKFEMNQNNRIRENAT